MGHCSPDWDGLIGTAEFGAQKPRRCMSHKFSAYESESQQKALAKNLSSDKQNCADHSPIIPTRAIMGKLHPEQDRQI